MKRVLDPKLRSSQIAELEPHVVDAEEKVTRARKGEKFDYDAPFEGIKALDRLHLPGEAQVSHLRLHLQIRRLPRHLRRRARA
jgi:hypothetical protein